MAVWTTLMLATAIAATESDCARIAEARPRLACFDAAAQPAPTPPATPLSAEGELAASALDAYLASTLLDPTSPIQYQVTDLFECSAIGPGRPAGQNTCMCYSINAKNRMGAFVGSEIVFVPVTIHGEHATLHAAFDDLDPGTTVWCEIKRLIDRPVSNITDLVNR